MLNLDGNIITALIIYLASCYILYNYKHEKMFDENGNFKTFGLGREETIFPFWLITTLIGISCYYFLIIRGNSSNSNIESFF
tara:strand:+ start:896 stop:1141 length:246 start_codon:yes stop_codon:yes gene_type:complete